MKNIMKFALKYFSIFKNPLFWYPLGIKKCSHFFLCVFLNFFCNCGRFSQSYFFLFYIFFCLNSLNCLIHNKSCNENFRSFWFNSNLAWKNLASKSFVRKSNWNLIWKFFSLLNLRAKYLFNCEKFAKKIYSLPNLLAQ